MNSADSNPPDVRVSVWSDVLSILTPIPWITVQFATPARRKLKWIANLFLLAHFAGMASAISLERYNVIWKSPSQDDFPDVLQPGVWQHVSVVMAKERVDVYLNGRKLQKR